MPMELAHDPALTMKKYAPHLRKAPELESYEAVDGKHFLQEDSSGAIADEIASVPMLTDDSQIGSDVRVWVDEDDRTDFDQQR
jgi:hypothetical protein